MSKYIKNFIIGIFIFVAILSLSACDPPLPLYNRKKDVICIELVNYNSFETQSNSIENCPFLIEKLEILEKLDSEKFEDFLTELPKISLAGTDDEWIINSPNGLGVRLMYHDKSFTLITVSDIEGIDCIFVGDYDADTNIEHYFGIDSQELIYDFRNLVDKYFTEAIKEICL